MQRSLNRFTGGANLVHESLALDNTAFEMASNLYPLAKRYVRFGKHQKAGLPKPGSFTGFPATLAMSQATVSNAFITSFLWSLILLAVVAISIIGLKLAINVSVRAGIIKENRFLIFRENWWDYLESTLCRVVRSPPSPSLQFNLNVRLWMRKAVRYIDPPVVLDRRFPPNFAGNFPVHFT